MEIPIGQGIEGTIKKNSYRIEIGGKSPAELERTLTEKDIYVIDWARGMMRSPAFSTLGRSTEIQVARLTPGNLGFTQYPTTEQLYKQAQSFGLERLPAEAGPQARLQDTKQRQGDWYYIAMNPITNRYGHRHIFSLERDGARLGIASPWAHPGYHWDLDSSFLFGVRK